MRHGRVTTAQILGQPQEQRVLSEVLSWPVRQSEVRTLTEILWIGTSLSLFKMLCVKTDVLTLLQAFLA